MSSSVDSLVTSELLARLLKNRNITEDEEISRYLLPDYERDLHDPYLYNDMEKAVRRIVYAVENGESLIIYGDYDCDGIPGSVVLHDFFKKAGYDKVRVYIPHRHNEGYGLNKEAISSFASEGVTLLITVDSGITDVEEVAHAHSLGIDVIITDHHLPQAVLPPAYAILNAKRVDNTYPFEWLCGAGVAFKLVQALMQDDFFTISPGWEKWLLDVVGIATIADMVPLIGENRVLATYGLKVLRQTRRPGLLHLLRKVRLAPDNIREDTIGFDIGPRINSASRLDIPMNGFRLLATRNTVEAGMMAAHLESLNSKRKRLVRKAIAEAESLEIGDVPIVVVGSHDWPVGIVGLIAGRLVERYNRPVFVWGSGGSSGEVRGSCRSDGTVNLVALMEAAETGTFTHFGGHEVAGGFGLLVAEIEQLAERLAAAYKKVPIGDPSSIDSVHIDGDLNIDDVTEETLAVINKCAPFGEGNPRPHFVFKSVPLLSKETFGKTGTHVKLIAQTKQGPVTCIQFFNDMLPVGETASFVGSIEESFFGHKRELRVRIHEFI